MLKTTPFHPRTSALCQGQSWRRWSGYVAASSYELTHEHEYAAIRNAAALFDVTPLYKYMIEGPDAARLLDRIITRDVAGCKVGQVLYTPWCDSAGKVLDDGTVSRLDEELFRMTSAHPGLLWLHQNAVGMDVRIDDASESTAALALQGPTSLEILNRIADADLGGLRFFRVAAAHLDGIPVTISRTGYTGDLGYEIWVDRDDALPLWDALIAAGMDYGITPAGLLALDIARNEAGLILIDVDYVSARRALIEGQKSSPFELGLGWAVKLDKAASFLGRRALVEERERGSAWQFVGLEIEWESLERLYADAGLPPALPTTAWRGSVPIFSGRRQIGYATSGCWSPLLKKYIAQAHVEAAHAATGTPLQMEITVEHRPRRAAARVTERPFFDPERKRAYRKAAASEATHRESARVPAVEPG